MRTMMKGKIHRVRVTAVNADYEGSITIDRALMRAADIIPYEMVHVLDVSNGVRFQTYAIEGGKGEVCVNGAAARLVSEGDIVIILSYQDMPESEARLSKPRMVYVDESNAIVRTTEEAVVAQPW